MNRIKLLKCLFIFLFFVYPIYAQQYILIGWNDLGMHCSNKDFSKIAVLPPYNNIHAQLILKSSPTPQIVTSGYTVEYSIPGNTYSVGKTNFWDYAQQLFNLPSPLAPNIGLTGNGLTGSLVPVGNYFIATAIPITPYPDNDLAIENPYQLIHLVAKAIANDSILASTDVVIPVSNEISCVSSGCHSSEQSILNEHESVSGFNSNGPNLCANCHASNALGTTGNPDAGIFSRVIHSQHQSLLPANEISTCYKCHPGTETQCLRDVMGKNPTNPLICQNCHGTMSTVASSISNGRRPWLDEPKCGDVLCHGSNYAEETNKLFRESQGHGGLYCSACHGSPHAILPTVQPNDNLQNINLQGFAGTLKVCTVCHETTPTGPGPHGIILDVNENGSIISSLDYQISNYPNPFNPITHISYNIPKGTFVSIKIFDTLGKEIATIVNEYKPAGKYEKEFNAADLPSGIYFYRLQTDSYVATKKMALLK
jgi:hypothetical protein